jgi:hypothetical protein
MSDIRSPREPFRGRTDPHSHSRSLRYLVLRAVLVGLSTLLSIAAQAQVMNGLAAIYDTRLTPGRSDDSLIARVPVENFFFNEVHYLNEGIPVADLLFENGATFRLVFQINSTSDWDYEPKDSGKGFCALAGTNARFGRVSAPVPGIAELLLTDAFVADELDDPIDFVVGLTRKFDPRVPWSMVSDPWTDPVLDDKTQEIGSLVSAIPPETNIGCVDKDKNWELTGNCEKERYYFYELWFQSDLDWHSGDTADVYLHLEGKPVPKNIEQLHLRFRFVDDDTIPPVMSDFSPEIVPQGLSFTISCRITDPSGVYDDGTGSSGQGVYLLWDDDGSLADDAHEILMSPVGGGYYAADAQIGPHGEGSEILYSVHACDNDADGGRIDDRSRGASEERTVQILGSVYIFDEHSSLYPASAYAGEEGVSIHLELNNPMPMPFVLEPATTVSFTDGAHVVTANLRNQTTLPAGANHFPVSFDAVQVPPQFFAPDTVDLMLDAVGTYSLMPFQQAWAASSSNRLIVMRPRILITARPAVSTEVHPGDASVEILRFDVMNDSAQPVSVDSLVTTNVTRGGGGVPLSDADFRQLRLYARSAEFAANDEMLRDSLAAFAATGADTGELDAARWISANASDTLLARATFEGGEARFRLAGGRSIPAKTTRFWYVVADVDSFLASDGDTLDLAIPSPDSMFVTGAAPVEFAEAPLNSEGAFPVDGMRSFQLRFEETIPDTLYLGDADQPVLSFVAPPNGHLPDVLTAVSIANFGDAEVDDLVEHLALWEDDGDAFFSPASDLHIGDFAATGDRFELSGLARSMDGPKRFFVVADFAFGTLGVLDARFGIPAGGIEYLSRNDGPIDGDLVPEFGQVLLRREIVSIDALPLPVGARYPGDGEVAMLALAVGNNTLGDVTIDSLRVRGDSSLFTCESGKLFRLYIDDGDASFDPGVDTEVAEAAWSGGKAFFTWAAPAIAPGSQRVFFVAAALDSFLTADGETLSVGVASADDIGLSLAPSTSIELFRLDADFPIASAGCAVTDGMLAHQIVLHSHGDSLIVDRKENVLALDFHVPGNACLADTLRGFTVVNLGTAGSAQIERVLLWRDDGDGLCDPAADSLVAVFAQTAVQTYAVAGLSESLAGLSGARFFVTIDVAEKIETGGTVDLAIPVMGIAVASGNDGPIDRETGGSGILTIPVPDRLTLFTSILGNKRVRPGEEHTLNLVLGIYNSYQETKTLERLDLLSVGSSRPGEIAKVEAYADSDEDGLFNPAVDGLLEEAQPGEAGYSFHELGAALKPYRSTLIFISYDTPLAGLRDSVRIDFQVSDKSSIAILGSTPVIEGDFPLNSAGVDITDGMVSAQMRILSVPSARVSPGAVDVPCLSFTLPCNGFLDDVLEGIAVENRGTASQGQDVRYVKLWKDTGGMPLAFDTDDQFLAFLVWDGGVWKTVAPLAEPLPCEGLVLHVTADIASSAQDGRSLNLCVPLGGVTVSSGNDGPIDGRACGPAEIDITTDPLFVSLTAPAAVTRDQVFEVRMAAMNAADTTLLGVEPDSFAFSGTGSCSQVSGPVPASIDLPGKSDSAFVWTFRAQSTGDLVFSGMARQAAGPEASRIGSSDTIRVDEIPDNVTVALLDRAPVSLNRGQEDIPLIEMTIGYDPPSGFGAPVELTSIELAITDGAGAPLSAQDAVSRVRLRDEVKLLCSAATDAIAQSTVPCTLSEPVILSPGASKTIRISIDVPTDAPASNFRMSVASSGAIALADRNSGAVVPFSGGAFPWSTNAVTLRDPAHTLLVRLVSLAPARVNTGQSRVGAFDLVLENNGGASAAPVSVSEIVLHARDSGGDTIDAGAAFKAFRLAGDGGNTYAYVESFAGASSIRCALQPALNVAAGVPVTLHGTVDCLAQPSVPGFTIVLRDSLDVAARDVNSGQPVEVEPKDGTHGFPMCTDVSLFSDPLSGVAVGGWGLMQERIAAGTTDAAALRLVLAHRGAPQESPFSCGGITVRLLDELGGPIAPADVFDAVRVRKGAADISSVYINASHGSDIRFDFAPPLIVSPGGADTLDIRFDLDASPIRSRFQLQVNAAGIAVADATDGREDIPLTGSFPVASGLGTVIYPVGSVAFDAAGLFPANISAGVETGCMRMEFSRGTELTGSRVFVEGIVLDVLDEGERAVDPSGVIAALRLYDEHGDIGADWLAIDGRLTVSIVDTLSVGDGETRSFTLAVATAANPPVKALSLRIASSDAIACGDEATGGAVAVTAASGAFPFGSGKAAILARDIEASFSNYPNPFVAGRGKTTITFYLPGAGSATVRVFTITGERVRTIVENKQLAAGLHQEFSWDGTNGSGNTVLNGVYYLVLTVSVDGREQTFTRKVALVQ